MNGRGTAFLTPAFDTPCKGHVHSVFARSANLMMALPGGKRMLTVCLPSMPGVPDSVIIGPDDLKGLENGMDAALVKDGLLLGTKRLPLSRTSVARFRIGHGDLTVGAERFFALTVDLKTGFDLIPEKRRAEALRALCTAGACACIGLGPGLTPSYDDALTGVMAVYRAADRPPPFSLRGLENTTAVSARYLLLASEGFFSGPVIRVTEALSGRDDMKEAVTDMLRIGATSGADTLKGIGEALRHCGLSMSLTK